VLHASKEVAGIAAMPRPKIVGDADGVITFTVDAATRQILGATLFCIDSQELVNLVALAMRAGTTADELQDGIWTHPSSTEALNEVLAELAPFTG
jgi:pyruvate/2-oxoglutarate dehydrogenase complex dihydrolipoamide dehydrogenase (E3) component